MKGAEEMMSIKKRILCMCVMALLISAQQINGEENDGGSPGNSSTSLSSVEVVESIFVEGNVLEGETSHPKKNNKIKSFRMRIDTADTFTRTFSATLMWDHIERPYKVSGSWNGTKVEFHTYVVNVDIDSRGKKTESKPTLGKYELNLNEDKTELVGEEQSGFFYRAAVIFIK